MTHATLSVDRAGLREALLARLRGRAFHVTCLSRLPAIIEDGAIRANPTGERASGFGSADQSYCRRRAAVSVFDYRAVTDEQLRASLDACAPDLPARACDFALAVLVLRPRACAALVTWDQIAPADRYRWMLVPRVEACYLGDLPVEDVDEVLEVRITPPPSPAS